MSTKCTISYDDSYHLYEECFDTDNVYLNIKSKDWSYNHNATTISIPIKTWRAMVEDWQKYHWSSHPEKDNYRMTEKDWEERMDSLDSILKLRKQKSEETDDLNKESLNNKEDGS